jgi:gamma-glutamyltranspeptidase / glutathione hydrolase
VDVGTAPTKGHDEGLAPRRRRGQAVRSMTSALAAVLATLLAAPAVSPRAAIATAHPLASEAGAEVLRAGGNAVDAAVAAALVLGVVQDESSGLGGGGFALVWQAKARKLTVLDFRESAPAASTPGMFLVGGHPDPALARQGGLAVAVPGAVKGYAELSRRFGTLPFAKAAEPAARVAERGFTVGRYHAAAATERLACLRGDAASASEFLLAGRGPLDPPVPLAPGATLKRPDLARTLRQLGKDPEAFYRGPLAERIAAAVRVRGGIMTAADLAAYRTRDREALWGRYKGRHVASMPPPSAGGAIVIGLLQALERDDPAADGLRPEGFLHAFIEVEKRLFAERSGRLADPDALPSANPSALELVDPAYDLRLRAQVGPRATEAFKLAPPVEVPAVGAHTSHLSVIDAEGNAVSLTTSVNEWFGACVTVPGTGLLLNDSMGDFDAAPGVPNAFGLVGSGVNGPAPGKRPLSSMAPTLVFDDQGRVELAVGSPGGSTIPSTVAQVIINYLGIGMPLDQALGTPRLHHQWLPDVVQVEPYGLDAATLAALRARGHAVEFRKRPFGNPQAAAVDLSTGLREAASEPRYEGRPAVP